MDSLQTFMNEVYMPKPDGRITIKEIYEAFKAWVVAKYGYKAWNEIGQKQVYAELKSSQDYQYVRFREGYCLKGIAYRDKPMTTTFVAPKIAKQKSHQIDCVEHNSKATKSPQIESTKLILEEPGVNTPIEPSITYLTLNIIPWTSGDEMLQTEPSILEELTVIPSRHTIPRPPSIIIPNLGKKQSLQAKLLDKIIFDNSTGNFPVFLQEHKG